MTDLDVLDGRFSVPAGDGAAPSELAVEFSAFGYRVTVYGGVRVVSFED